MGFYGVGEREGAWNFVVSEKGKTHEILRGRGEKGAWNLTLLGGGGLMEFYVVEEKKAA